MRYKIKRDSEGKLIPPHAQYDGLDWYFKFTEEQREEITNEYEKQLDKDLERIKEEREGRKTYARFENKQRLFFDDDPHISLNLDYEEAARQTRSEKENR